MNQSGINAIFSGRLLAEGKSLIVCFVHDSLGESTNLVSSLVLTKAVIYEECHEVVSTLPLVSREAKKRSWPDANAG